MSEKQGPREATLEMELGAMCVRFWDEQGLHVSFSFAALASEGKRPNLLGCFVEAARRKLGRKMAREIAEEFPKHFTPTPAEEEACRHLVSQGEDNP